MSDANRLLAHLPEKTRGPKAAEALALLALVAFVPPSLVLAPAAAAAVGLALYIVVLGLVRPAALRGAWRYLRALA